MDFLISVTIGSWVLLAIVIVFNGIKDRYFISILKDCLKLADDANKSNEQVFGKLDELNKQIGEGKEK